VFCAAVPDALMSYVLCLRFFLQIRAGSLPVRYLGMPLITGKLTYNDCFPLIEKITTRIRTWTTRHLSFSGRLQLTQSVLNSILMYLSSIFILPKKIVKAIEQKFNPFLWRGPDDRSGAKVCWEQACLPKEEGGLGLKRVED
jgi:hypothetical protein